MSEGSAITRLAVQEIVAGGAHTLLLSGELDMASSPELHEHARRLCTNGTRAITLDLSGLTFIDVRGLRAILDVRELSQRHGYELRLIAGASHIQRLFELTGILDALPFGAHAVHAAPPSA
jgi:anti-sigma B factor antagonist